MEYPDPWPLDALVLCTPRLRLRPDDDAGLRELVGVVYDGVHPPERMPFSLPWTDADRRELGRNSMQHHWARRAALSAASWQLQFLVRRDGRVVGAQSLAAEDFAVTREVNTGSWIGLRYQGRGYGTEMRAAVLAFAFDHLGARTALSAAYTDNAASLAVSGRLGYRRGGQRTVARRGAPATEIGLMLSREDFAAHRPDWALGVEGLDGCRELLLGRAHCQAQGGAPSVSAGEAGSNGEDDR